MTLLTAALLFVGIIPLTIQPVHAFDYVAPLTLNSANTGDQWNPVPVIIIICAAAAAVIVSTVVLASRKRKNKDKDKDKDN